MVKDANTVDHSAILSTTNVLPVVVSVSQTLRLRLLY